MNHTWLLVASLLGLVPLAAAQDGSFTTSGSGCVAHNNVVYELFPVGAFDLDNTAHEYVPNASGGYVVVPTSATILPPSGAETSLNADDTVFGRIPLSFTFEYPAGLGSTTAVDIAAHGHVNFELSTDTRCCDGTAALLDALADAPSIAAFNTDLNTSTTSTTGAGRIWYEEQVASGLTVFLATWEHAGECGVAPPAADHNFQIQLWDDPAGDRIVVAYGTTTVTTDATFVGWSAGRGQPDLGGIDFSADLPLDLGDGVVQQPLTLDSMDVPKIGNTFDWDITGVPASSSLGALLVGGPIGIPGGAPLDIIGFESCLLYTDGLIVTLPLTLTPPTASTSISLPGSSGLVGLTFESQAVVVAPGQTSAGGITSNLGSLAIGDNVGLTPGIVVLFEGANTFLTSPRPQKFFNVFNNSALPAESITGLQVDFFSSSDPGINAGRTWFDVGGLSAATGQFDLGDAASFDPVCPANTYGGTDVTTGLDYVGADPAPCATALGATTGWRASNVGAGGPSTIDFVFTNFGTGQAFEFEADTDGGPISASGLAGAWITVTTTLRVHGPSPLTVIDNDTAIVVF